MSRLQAAVLRKGVADRSNILVAGGTSTGKTTLTNALLAEVAKTSDRVVLIEDTRELQCASPNLVALRTKDGVASLSDLVRSEEHTSELQSLMRISYAVLCLKKKKN